MNKQESLIRAYDRALRSLPGSGKKNEEYRAYVRSSIREVFAARPEAGEAELRELLGDPETAREDYIRSLSPEELQEGQREKRKRRDRRLAILLPLCLLFVVIVGLFIRFAFFPTTTVSIARPVDGSAEKYVERPMLMMAGGLTEVPARAALQARLFVDNCTLQLQEMEERYPERCHIVCSVTAEKGKTTVLWTGVGTTAEGVEEAVRREYVHPCRYRVNEPEKLSGEAAERARQGEEAAKQAAG